MVPSARLVRVGMALARWVPPRILHAVARGAGRLGWYLAPRRRAVIRANLAHLVPLGSPGDREAIGRKVLPNLLQGAIDLWRIPSLSPEAFSRLVEVDGIEHLRQAMAAAHGVIMASGHLGPYELAGAWLALRGIPVHALVESLDEETARALSAYRTATGMQLLPREHGLRGVIRALRGGDVVALVCDRMVGRGAPGLEVPWGSGTREVPTGPATISIATGAPIVIGHITRSSSGNSGAGYRLILDPPLAPEGHTVEELTRVVASRLSAHACAYPDQWFVFQPEWRDPVAP